MPKLKAEHKRYLVERLACYETPTEAAIALADTFGVVVERSHVAYYDAGRVSVRSKLAADLVALFDETRARFRDATEDIAVAQRTYRLRVLDRIVRDERSPVLRMQAMEQAAKECGDVFTNRRDVTTAGRPLPGPLPDLSALSSDELMREYRERTGT